MEGIEKLIFPIIDSFMSVIGWSDIFSFLALFVSISTLIWHIHFYERDYGKLTLHITPNLHKQGTYVCNIVNTGHKPVTPLGINCIVRGKRVRIEPNEGFSRLGKVLQPGEIMQLLYIPSFETVNLLLSCDKIVAVDALNRDFALSKFELERLKKELKTSEDTK